MLFQQIFTESDIDFLIKFSTLEHSLEHPTLAYESGRAHFANIMVYPDTLADKYFVPKPKEIPAAPQLVWQQVEKSLPEDFFTKGVEFFNKQSLIQMTKGRLTLTKNRLYPPKAKTQKWQQYSYLGNPKAKDLPEKTKGEGSLFTQLVQRFRTLRKLRAPAFEENVLKAAPPKCEKPLCGQAKLELLKINGFLNPKQLEGLQWMSQENQKLQAIDQAFLEYRKVR